MERGFLSTTEEHGVIALLESALFRKSCGVETAIIHTELAENQESACESIADSWHQ